MAETTNVINILLNVKKKGMEDIKKLESKFRGTTNQVKNLNAAYNKLDGINKQIARSTGKMRMVFQGWALSIMFFGMAIMRVFTNILKSSVATFNTVMSSVEGAINPFQQLNNVLELIKFGIGDAIASTLEPFMGKIIEIGFAIYDWIQRNQTLVTILLAVGAVLGFILFVVGTLVLGIHALVSAFGVMSSVWTTLSATLSASGGLATMLGVSTVVPIILGIIAALALLWVMWQTNMGNIRELFASTFGIVLNIFKDVFGTMFNVFKKVFAAVIAIFNGDWDEALALLWSAFQDMTLLIARLFVNLGAMIVNIFIFALNMIQDFIVKTIIGGMLSLIGSALDGLGFDRAAAKVRRAERSVKESAERSKIGYISAEDIDGFNDSIGISKDATTSTSRNVSSNTTVINNTYYGVGESSIQDRADRAMY